MMHASSKRTMNLVARNALRTAVRTGGRHILLAAMMTLTAAAQRPATLVGIWDYAQGGQTLISIELRADGKGIMGADEFTWSAQASTLVASMEGESETYAYRVSGNTLFLSGGDLEREIALVRRGDATAGSTGGRAGAEGAASPAGGNGRGVAMELVGTWCYMANVYANDGGRMSSECVTFHENGTYEYSRESSSSGQYGSAASQESDSGTWSLEGGTLRAQSRVNGPLQYTLEKRNHPKNTGDPMIVIDGRAFVTASQRPPW